ncbi:O-methyltransferase [Streptomyces sp. Li-HN-5-11]|uniref:O-methyltransferase n=1 Tax=Streptomyces sp. Li-HN-5-11 TaxID=3075432 RepID=UPI0028A6C5D0|nr:O-methyltransferase [Streptomyces sp. Li-HN-5-11]WNM32728.1 O-methyltransferase [Streptomyces sp. Li-HN-5-11]
MPETNAPDRDGFPTDYVRAVLGNREPVLEEILRHAVLDQGMPAIQVDDNAARVLQMLVGLRRPRHVIEIGTLFGFSTIHLARGLPEGGRVTTLEIDSRAADLARANLEKAGVADRVEVVVGDAVDYLSTVPPESVGMLFIDGDKKSYPRYLAAGYPLLEPGGLLVADDAFALGDFSGESADGGDGTQELKAIHTYNRAVGRSPRLFSAFIGTRNGLLVSCKG